MTPDQPTEAAAAGGDRAERWALWNRAGGVTSRTGDRRDRRATARDDRRLDDDRAGEDRDRSGEGRGAAGELRDDAARVRDSAADSRDSAADSRDNAANSRDQAAGDGSRAAAAAHDRHLSAADRTAARHDRERSVSDRSDEGRDRAAAGRDRVDAATDRAVGAVGRTRAGRDRGSAQADRRDSFEEHEHVAFDGLTGAYTRSAGLVELERELARARRSRHGLVLGFLDVDGLKQVNDRGGHAAGDVLLVRVVEAVRAHLRTYDLVVRFGGDEFLCAVPGLGLDDVAGRLDLVNASLGTGGSLSTGLAELRPTDDLAELIARADAELYRRRARDRST